MSFVTHDKHSESRDSFMVQITQSRTGDAMTGYCTGGAGTENCTGDTNTENCTTNAEMKTNCTGDTGNEIVNLLLS